MTLTAVIATNFDSNIIERILPEEADVISADETFSHLF
jgi:hypothetical protein